MAYAPQNFTATVATNSVSTINLAWDDDVLGPVSGPGNWDRTYIYRSTDGITYAYLAYVNFGTETYADTSCASNDQYWYKARHFELGTSEWSSYSTSDDDWTYPDPPTGLSATGASTTTANLTWTNGDTYNSVKVERNSVEISSETGTATSYADTGLTPSTTYTYRLRGYNSTSALYSAYSATDTATTTDAHTDTVTATITITPVVTDLASGIDTVTATVTITPVVTDIRAHSDSVTATITLSPTCWDNTVVSTDFSMFLGDDDGNLYLHDDTYKSDNGASIISTIETKQTDFTEMYPELLDRWKTLYWVRIWYVDLETDSDITLYISTNGGNTWTLVGTKTVGASHAVAKSVDYHKIMTGQYFSFKVQHASTTQKMQILGLECEIEDGGDHYIIG